ncbi:hypothetical protein FQN54_003437 [Arachnomyces sp. PD_36]|nr:hypothetical protein FQN54_003437 [Arachnomyces sp. PD_36]
MKGALIATAAAALAGSAIADGVHFRRHDHKAFHNRRHFDAEPEATCGCVTKVITVTGEPTLVPVTPSATPSVTPSESVTTLYSTAYSTVTVSASKPPVIPTPVVNFPTPGTYTVPATTITVTDETTVCGATSTELPSGTQTYGGVTTVVETDTTIVCPYATVKPTEGTVTSVIETTTYVCPSAGTYTIAPTTTSLSTSTVMVYPTPATYTPGTYTQDEQTVTVTETDYNYVCPNPTGAPTVTPVPVPEPTYVPTPEPTEPAPAPPSGGIGGSGDKYGITYSPYTDSGECKDAVSVIADLLLAKLAGFEAVRIYSTDCDGLQTVGDAASLHGLKMILGVFIDGAGIPKAQEQVNEITNWAQWDKVDLIVVGNEALFGGIVDAGTLASFISSSAQSFKSAGYSGLVTTTEPLNIWQEQGAALCSCVDVLGANLHPFFNSEVSPSDAGSFVKSQMDLVSEICPGKEVVTLETGWPSGGSANGLALPGIFEQLTAVTSIVQEVGKKSVLFSFANEKWKPQGEFGVEQNWGCIDAFE